MISSDTNYIFDDTVEWDMGNTLISNEYGIAMTHM